MRIRNTEGYSGGAVTGGHSGRAEQANLGNSGDRGLDRTSGDKGGLELRSVALSGPNREPLDHSELDSGIGATLEQALGLDYKTSPHIQPIIQGAYVRRPFRDGTLGLEWTSCSIICCHIIKMLIFILIYCILTNMLPNKCTLESICNVVRNVHLHLSDAFIQSDLQCIQAIHFLSVCVCSLGIEPTTFALLTQCCTPEPQEHLSRNIVLCRTS